MTRFGITMGDPCGVGPEIILKALRSRPEYLDRCVVFGSVALLAHYNETFGYGLHLSTIAVPEHARDGQLNIIDPCPIALADISVGKVCATGGNCAFLYVKAAIHAALAHQISSVVTAPLNKEALNLAGHHFAGHTELFAEFTHGQRYAMLLWSDKLKAIHATTHVSLRNACDLCTKEREIDVIQLAYETLQKAGYPTPRIAVAGLNPHAGEGGIFGDEEIHAIAPAVAYCKAKGLDVTGPIAPDTVFLRAVKGEFDIVVAQYHDQGHIPLKLLAFDSGVNITVGLDVIRTSVDHGTAFDIAGTGIAKEDSLIQAIEIGNKL